MSDVLQVTTLGGLALARNGIALTGFHSRKVDALVVYLSYTRQAEMREQVADLLWDDETQATANLRVLLTDLRQFLAPFFLITRTQVGINPDSTVWLDTAQFEAALETVRKQQTRDGALTPATAGTLEQALALYHGDFLKGFYIRSSPRFEEWVLLEQERLRRLALNALQRLTQFYLEQRDYTHGIKTAARLFEIDPLNELTQQQMMQLLARSGEQHAALAHYEKYRQLLAAELNAEPSPETTALREQIRAGTFAEKIGESARSNLPRMLTPFVGRAEELADLETRLSNPNVALVTLLGPGGVGKTRLALRAAERLYPHFRDGVTFVALAAVTDANLVATTLAETLNVTEKGGEALFSRVKNYLRAKQMLLVMDNFEQVLDAAPLLTELLAACPHLKILATSREKLNVYGEHEFPVSPLPTPDLAQLPARAADVVETIASYPAVALFVQRATAAQSDFKLTTANARVVAEICTRLDGLPLAIELAAAQIRTFPPLHLLARLNNRLNVLTGGERDRAPRHQTLRATLDWSYTLLDTREKRGLRQLAVFCGGWDLNAARELMQMQEDSVAPATLNLLTSLVDKSLVQRVGRDTEEPRFTMFEVVREYARELSQLHNERAALERHHALYFLELARQAQQQMQGPSQVRWLNQMEHELDNVRAALQWTIANREIEIGLELAHCLGRFWTVHDRWSEGRSWLEQLLALPTEQTETLLRAEAMYSVGLLATWMSDFAAARGFFGQALALSKTLGAELVEARILSGLAAVLQSQNELKTARTLAAESQALFEKVGTDYDLAWCNLTHAANLVQGGNFGQARPEIENILAVFDRMGDHWGSGVACSYLGLVARFTGDVPSASLYKARALALLTEVGDVARVGLVYFFLGSPSGEPAERDAELAFFRTKVETYRRMDNRVELAQALLGLGGAEHRHGREPEAQALFTECLALCAEVGLRHEAAECLEGLAGVAAAQDQPERATRLFGAVDTSSRFLTGALAEAWRGNYGTDLALVRAQLDEAMFNALWAEGRALSLEQAIEYALNPA